MKWIQILIEGNRTIPAVLRFRSPFNIRACADALREN